MKIFLTGAPHCGKSTLINKIINKFDPKQGFVTNEIPDGFGGRLGFKTVDDRKNTAILAHIDNQSTTRVSKYGVNITTFDKFIEPLLDIKPNTLLYIDEIGQMELYSEKFIKLVEIYLGAPNNLIATMSSVYKHELIDRIYHSNNCEIVKVTEQNRDNLAEILTAKLKRNI